MLECDDASYYTGYTKNLARRYRLHVDGKAGVKYTRMHKPVRIAQCWRLFGPVGTALKVEYYLKKKTRAAKDRFVEFPAELKSFVSRAIERDVEIYTVDPGLVEREALALGTNDLRNGADPFSHAPPADIHDGARGDRDVVETRRRRRRPKTE